MEYMSVAEAAEELGVSSRRVRSLVESAQLAGRQVGGRWLIEREAVESRKRQQHPSGRPLSPSSAWHILAALSGEDEALDPWLLPLGPGRSSARTSWLKLSDLTRQASVRLRQEQMRRLSTATPASFGEFWKSLGWCAVALALSMRMTPDLPRATRLSATSGQRT